MDRAWFYFQPNLQIFHLQTLQILPCFFSIVSGCWNNKDGSDFILKRDSLHAGWKNKHHQSSATSIFSIFRINSSSSLSFLAHSSALASQSSGTSWSVFWKALTFSESSFSKASSSLSENSFLSSSVSSDSSLLNLSSFPSSCLWWTCWFSFSEVCLQSLSPVHGVLQSFLSSTQLILDTDGSSGLISNI